MRKSVFKLSAFVALTTASVNVSANWEAQSFDLKYNDTVMSGENTLLLKKGMMEQYGISTGELQEMELVRVSLVAKSQFGQGTAALRVGSSMGYEKRVYGTASDFDSWQPKTYDHLTLTPDGMQGSGPWQIALRGTIKVRRVIVEVRVLRRQPPRQPGLVIRCESIHNRLASCGVRGSIASVRLINQRSFNSCNYGRTWGFSEHTVWVNDGCRGDFEVTMQNGREPGRGREGGPGRRHPRTPGEGGRPGNDGGRRH